MTPLVAHLLCPMPVVDRIEGEIAVLDWCGARRTDVAVLHLPPGVTEGDAVPRPPLFPLRSRPAPATQFRVGRRGRPSSRGAAPPAPSGVES